MPHTWYVTFEAQKRGDFAEAAKPPEDLDVSERSRCEGFCQTKFDEGLIVYAGTINPVLPRRLIPSSDILSWIDQGEGEATAGGQVRRETEK
jgi:hypothetical protein